MSRDFSLEPDVYSFSDSGELGEADLDNGKYNLGYVIDSDGFEGIGGQVVDDPEEVILWTPLDERTPEMKTQEDLLSYHLSRYRNAEIMRDEGLNVPDVSLVEAELDPGYATFLATPYVNHDCFDQRPKFPGGDSRRNNPHVQDPFYSPERDSFEADIDRALQSIDDQELVANGSIINAGNEGLDPHNKNWGLVDGELVRLDIGEVPAQGAIWENLPYSGPEEFYREEGIRDRAGELIDDLDNIDSRGSIPDEYRQLMS